MQSGLTCLELIAGINRIDVDLRAIIREQGISEAEIPKEELLRVAHKLGFRAKLKTIRVEHLVDGYPLPAIYILKQGGYGVILKCDKSAGKVIVFSVDNKATKELTFAELTDQSNSPRLKLTVKA